LDEVESADRDRITRALLKLLKYLRLFARHLTRRLCSCPWRRSSYIRLCMLILVLGALAALLTFFAHKAWVANAILWVESLGIYGYVVFVLIFIVISMPFGVGYMLICLACGFLYGIALGVLTIFIGCGLGAAASYFVCQRFMRQWIERKVRNSRKLSAVMVAAKKNGFKISVLLRFIPIPLGIQTGLLAISNIRFPIFLLGSLLGMLPEQLLFAYWGDAAKDLAQIASGEEEMSPAKIAFMVIGVVVAIFLTVFLVWLGRRAIRKAMREDAEARAALELQDLTSGVPRAHTVNVASLDQRGGGGSRNGAIPLPDCELQMRIAETGEEECEVGSDAEETTVNGEDEEDEEDEEEVDTDAVEDSLTVQHEGQRALARSAHGESNAALRQRRQPHSLGGAQTAGAGREAVQRISTPPPPEEERPSSGTLSMDELEEEGDLQHIASVQRLSTSGGVGEVRRPKSSHRRKMASVMGSLKHTLRHPGAARSPSRSQYQKVEDESIASAESLATDVCQRRHIAEPLSALDEEHEHSSATTFSRSSSSDDPHQPDREFDQDTSHQSTLIDADSLI